MVAAKLVEPLVVGAKNSALKTLIDDAIELARCAREKYLGFNAVDVLILQARLGLPPAGIVLIAKLLVEADGFEMFFLLHFGNTFLFAHHLSFRIMRQTDGRNALDHEPRAFRHTRRILDD